MIPTSARISYDVLLIDDDPKFSQLIKKYLEQQAMIVALAENGASGITLARENSYDIILLDIFMPDINGIEVLRTIRAESQVPVVMLSAHNEETDRIVALEMGADDYVPKKFSARELLARMRAVLRRKNAPVSQEDEKSEDVFKLRRLALNTRTMEVRLEGVQIHLTYNEYRLLLLLMSQAGRVFTRDDLLATLSGRGFDIYDRSIDSLVSSLRHKLGDDPKNPAYIKTVRGAGYSLIE